MTHEDPLQVLGISPEAGEEEIRAAYLRKVKEYPPDRAPRDSKRCATPTRRCATRAVARFKCSPWIRASRS